MLNLSDIEPKQRTASKHQDERSRLRGRAWDAEPARGTRPIVRDVVSSAGQTLDPLARAFFESRLGHHFGHVRVHTDARAAATARALRAQAYTVGPDIAFDTGRYTPRTAAGLHLLAHELTHIVQQGASAEVQTLGMAAVDSDSEREAARTADLVVSGGQVGGISAQGNDGVVHRAIGDVLAGGALGGIAGAAIGSIFGPIGALIGGGIGLLAGLAAGEVAGAQRRELTGDERREAAIVFGPSLNMSTVHVAESSVMAVGGFARTPFDTIYFPPGTSRLGFPEFMPWLIHELTHVWQYQHGVSVTEKVWWALHGQSAYDYGGEAGLRAAASQNKRFTEFNTEQQASIAADFYKTQHAGQDTSAYDPFIAQLRAGGRTAGATTGPASPASGGGR
jgi:hypothetical protein